MTGQSSLWIYLEVLPKMAARQRGIQEHQSPSIHTHTYPSNMLIMQRKNSVNFASNWILPRQTTPHEGPGQRPAKRTRRPMSGYDPQITQWVILTGSQSQRWVTAWPKVRARMQQKESKAMRVCVGGEGGGGRCWTLPGDWRSVGEGEFGVGGAITQWKKDHYWRNHGNGVRTLEKKERVSKNEEWNGGII